MRRIQFEKTADYIREIVFGLEDSLVSTLGVVTGIAIGTNDKPLVILSAIIVIFVEAVSMAAGTYLSTKSYIEVEEAQHLQAQQESGPIQASLVMGFFYILGGFIPVLSYWIFPLSVAVNVSIVVTGITLFLVGAIKSIWTKRSWARSGFEMLVVSLAAAFIGYAI